MLGDQRRIVSRLTSIFVLLMSLHFKTHTAPFCILRLQPPISMKPLSESEFESVSILGDAWASSGQELDETQAVH